MLRFFYLFSGVSYFDSVNWWWCTKVILMYLSDFGGATIVGGGAMTSLKCTKFVDL